MTVSPQYEDPSFKMAAERELQLFSSGVENSCSTLQSRLLKLQNWTGSGRNAAEIHRRISKVHGDNFMNNDVENLKKVESTSMKKVDKGPSLLLL
ncbi:hypothetical protein FHG87_012867 [Trinorchestia longiramus]|nr:hypothetical protein FHG87_012867 [Trinorchestia longiramus]